ncbi:hypothetical protein D3874_27355 [Oleomonas cavernae]|uniref:General secretion pathway protein GspM n=1 Tax=Oleomonas cavernae TaxID=2320859 RepID=A0A418VUG7_9PROT|nr:type II secretion system protein GspM [Oleomonas cavernae]RJF80802.1 hypothetical protein D3874_27355 [Oleomonas cavernae]
MTRPGQAAAKRVAAFAILALLLLVTTSLVAGHLAGQQKVFAARAAALDHERRILARLIAEGAGVAGPAGSEAGENLLYQAPQAVIAAAQAQSKVTQVIAASGGTIVSSQPASPSEADGLTRLPLRVTFEADVAALTRILVAAESAQPLLVIEQMTVIDPDGTAPVRTTAARVEPNRLRVELAISAYWQAP